MASEIELADDEFLLRRIPPWHRPVPYQNIPDQPVRDRPPSPAFALDKGEEALSFNLESSLREAGEQLTYGCPPGAPGWGVARVSVGLIRSLHLKIVRDEKPHHILVYGLADLPNNERKRVQQTIAKASYFVVPPRVG